MLPTMIDYALPPSVRVVVLAGGKGTRLAPYTTVLPKPLMPVGDRPILEWVFEWLVKSGIGRVTLSVGHLAELIQVFFGDGNKFGFELDYVIEDEPLGTIAPLLRVPGLCGDFFVMNGDVLTDMNLGDLWTCHQNSGALLTIAVQRREVAIDFGVLHFDASGRLYAFEEKPRIAYDVSMGVYVLNERCLAYVPKKGPFGFDQLVLALLEANEPIQTFIHKGFWLDIGRPEDYDCANEWCADAQRASTPCSNTCAHALKVDLCPPFDKR